MRRNLIESAAAALVAGTLACGVDTRSSIQVGHAPTATVRPAETPRPRIQPFDHEQVIRSLYPELEEAGIALRGKDVLSSFKATAVFNLTEYTHNGDVAHLVYQFFERLASTASPLRDYPIGDNKRTLVIMHNNAVESRTMLIIPLNANRPNWQAVHGNAKEHSAASRIEGRNALGFVMIAQPDDDLFVTSLEKAMEGFANEACQQTISVRVYDNQGKPIGDTDELLAAKEVVCNSFGRLVAAGFLGKPYEQYDRNTRGQGILVQDFLLPLIAFTESSYNNFQYMGGILK